MGYRKPDPEYFAHIRRSLDVDYDAMIFVDDQEKNISGAEALGLAVVTANDDWTAQAQMLINKRLGGPG